MLEPRCACLRGSGGSGLPPMTADAAGPAEGRQPRVRVGIVGAGVMGRDIAEALATHGHTVVLVDLAQDILDAAAASVRASLRASALTGRGRPGSIAETLQRIAFTTDYDALRDVGFVIENVSENIDAKRAAYAALDGACAAETVVAANTSTHPIGELARLIRHPERVVGIHFMNPATTKPLVEVIAGERTSAAAMRQALDLLAGIGKAGVLVKDAPGFVSNRVLMLTINEAIHVVEAGTAAADDVDRIFVGCFGHAMGPLATADLIGLDTIQLSLESLRDRLGDAKFEPTALLREMIRSGRLGRKTGQGFFTYDLRGT
jgi:3-hydroxybutyryl-CoA dehydrogenase